LAIPAIFQVRRDPHQKVYPDSFKGLAEHHFSSVSFGWPYFGKITTTKNVKPDNHPPGRSEEIVPWNTVAVSGNALRNDEKSDAEGQCYKRRWIIETAARECQWRS